MFFNLLVFRVPLNLVLNSPLVPWVPPAARGMLEHGPISGFCRVELRIRTAKKKKKESEKEELITARTPQQLPDTGKALLRAQHL